MATFEAADTGRPGNWVTRDEVRDAIFEIMREGGYPSEAKIRAALSGRGSPSTVLRFAREIYVEMGTKGFDIDAPDVPPPLLEAAKILWRDARRIAEAEYDEARSEHAAQIDAFTETIARESERANQAEHQVAALTAQRERLDRDLGDLRRARARGVRLALVARRRGNALRAELTAELADTRRQHQVEIDGLCAAHATAIEKLEAKLALQAERHEAAERLSAQKVVDARSSAERAEKQANALREQMANAERAHVHALGEATGQAAAARSKQVTAEALLAAKDEELAESRAMARALAGNLEEVRREAAARAASQEAEISRLGKHLDESRSATEEIRRRLDQLTAENGELKVTIAAHRERAPKEGGINESR